MDFDFADILINVMELGASDPHITAAAPPMVRLRGRLQPLDYPKLSPQDTREIVYSILTEEQRKRLENDWQIDFSYTIPGRARFRVNAFYQRATVGAAFRLIPTRMPQLKDLGVPSILAEFTRKPRGFVLVTGPTGSGKSTTLAAMLDLINERRHEHIMTIEDPIEFLHRHNNCVVNQRELGADAQSFALALKSALRQDPDVILVGEMRDLETMSAALTAAQTGHLVLSTIHTIDAMQTVNRVIDIFPPHQQNQIRYQMADTLRGVISQRLLPSKSGVGRVPAVEVMVVTPIIRKYLLENTLAEISPVMKQGAYYGMQT